MDGWMDGGLEMLRCLFRKSTQKAHLFEWLLLHDNAALLLRVVGCNVKRVGACGDANMPP